MRALVCSQSSPAKIPELKKLGAEITEVDFNSTAALDAATSRYLRIAGDTLSACGLQDAATRATGK
ncbi:MAG: hypothetical protein LPK19_05455, partial [Hymenobacteraceae bacterium]|nr:hypothetical protein [Hymenobacteraceae bacterium]MDX5395646.1 hypothetical protein [Hymenobacteraceae bacterium]MDX5511700.1 hypothetical protein [Hymenobacteraceae bacterium]